MEISSLVSNLRQNLQDMHLNVDLDTLIVGGSINIPPACQALIARFIEQMSIIIKNQPEISYEGANQAFVLYVMTIIKKQIARYQEVNSLLNEVDNYQECLTYIFHMIIACNEDLKYQHYSFEQLENLKMVIQDICFNYVYQKIKLIFEDCPVNDLKESFIEKMHDKYLIDGYYLSYLYGLIEENYDELEALFLAKMF